MKTMKSLIVSMACLLLLLGTVKAQDTPDIIDFHNGQITWTNVNSALYYTVEWVSAMKDTNWTGSFRSLQDLQSSAPSITADVPIFIRIVGSSNAAHTATLSPTTAVVSAGYYATTNLTQVDADLAAANIATNVTIFGVAGTLSANGGTTYTRIVRLTGVLDFGNVSTGATKVATLTIWNDGDCAMTVAGIQYSDSRFSGTCSGKVRAGGSTNVTVTFAPLLAQGYSGTITVNCDNTGGTNTIACTGAGMSIRYVDNGDGTVTDHATGLMWTKNANHGIMSWEDAVAYCDNLVTNGYNDWRLPSVNRQDGPGGPMGNSELDTLGRANGDPTGAWDGTPGAPFTGVQSGMYRSRTTYANLPSCAWIVGMDTGVVDFHYKYQLDTYVWPVRGGH